AAEQANRFFPRQMSRQLHDIDRVVHPSPSQVDLATSLMLAQRDQRLDLVYQRGIAREKPVRREVTPGVMPEKATRQPAIVLALFNHHGGDAMALQKVGR